MVDECYDIGTSLLTHLNTHVQADADSGDDRNHSDVGDGDD